MELRVGSVCLYMCAHLLLNLSHEEPVFLLESSPAQTNLRKDLLLSRWGAATPVSFLITSFVSLSPGNPLCSSGNVLQRRSVTWVSWGWGHPGCFWEPHSVPTENSPPFNLLMPTGMPSLESKDRSHCVGALGEAHWESGFSPVSMRQKIDPWSSYSEHAVR